MAETMIKAAAIMINRKGYEDKGVRLIDGFINEHRPLIADDGDLIAFRLKPVAHPAIPEYPPKYGVGWSGDEGDHRWSISRRAEIIIYNQDNKPISVTISFSLNTLKPRNVTIGINGNILQNFSLGFSGAVVQLTPVTLSPGQNPLFIETDVPPELPGNGDPRKLSFAISNFVMATQAMPLTTGEMSPLK